MLSLFDPYIRRRKRCTWLLIILQGLINLIYSWDSRILPSNLLVQSKYCLNTLNSWDSRDWYLTSLCTIHIYSYLVFFFLLVQNPSGSHPTHAAIRSRNARQREASTCGIIQHEGSGGPSLLPWDRSDPFPRRHTDQPMSLRVEYALQVRDGRL